MMYDFDTIHQRLIDCDQNTTDTPYRFYHAADVVQGWIQDLYPDVPKNFISSARFGRELIRRGIIDPGNDIVTTCRILPKR
jgi:hypothetical protein